MSNMSFSPFADLPSTSRPGHSPAPSLSRSSSSGSSSAAPRGPPSTAPSSVSDLSHCVDASSFATLQSAMSGMFEKVLAEKDAAERESRAWEGRCGALEREVRRLCDKVERLEVERREGWKASITECSDYPRPLDAPPSPSWSAWPQPWASLSTSPATTPPASTAALPDTPPKPAVPQIDLSKPMSKQSPPPCNSFYLLGHCDVPACKWCHSYALIPAQIDEIRRGARFHICNALKNGVECEDDACPYGHFCPRGSACGRSNCVFNDEQHKHTPTAPFRTPARRR